MTFSNQAHFVELSKVRNAGFRLAVAHNVGLHKLIGQTLVGFLVGITLNLTLDDGVGGVILANLLEMGVFGRHSVFSQLGEGAVHNNFTLGVVQLQGILHSNHFPFCWLGLSGLLQEGIATGFHLLAEQGLTVFGLLIMSLFYQLGTGFVKLGDCRIPVQEPGLDFLIGESVGAGFLCFFCHCAKVHKLSHSGVLFIIVGEDVVLHIIVGQALIGRLGSLAGRYYLYVEAGVIATDFLESLVFVGTILGGAGVEGLGNFNGTGGGADSQILHSINLLFLLGLLPCRFCFAWVAVPLL